MEKELFIDRHLGPSETEEKEMLQALGANSLDSFIDQVVPATIRSKSALQIKSFPTALSERDALNRLKASAEKTAS